jgi:hypothetical protein
METRTGRETQEFLKQSMGVRNRVGIGLLYRTASWTGIQEEDRGEGQAERKCGMGRQE